MLLGFFTVAFMIIVNAIFAAYEMALATISRGRIMILVHLKKNGAQEALFMKDRMEGSLAVVQLGITLAGAIAAASGGVGMEDLLSPWMKAHWHLSNFLAGTLSLVCFIVPLTCLTIIFAELIPKTYAITHHEEVCMTLSPFMKWLGFLVYPIITVLEKIVKKSMHMVSRRKKQQPLPVDRGLHELNAAVAMARTSRLLDAGQEKILLSTAQLSVRPVKEIMISIEYVSMIPMTNTLSQALIHAHNDMHTRFPVCSEENNPQSIEGYVNFKDIIAALKLNPEDPTIKGIVRLIKRFLEDTVISQALEQMIAEKLHMALVVAPSGTVLGMITLEDIIEEIVGEIEDEYDRIPSYIHPYGDNGWLLGGGVTMAILAQTVGGGVNFSSQEEKMRLSDWIAQKVKKPLKGGEIIKLNGLQFMVRKMRRNKLAEAAITQTLTVK